MFIYFLPHLYIPYMYSFLYGICKNTFHYSKVRFRNSLTKEGCGTSLCIKEANSTSCVTGFMTTSEDLIPMSIQGYVT